MLFGKKVLNMQSPDGRDTRPKRGARTISYTYAGRRVVLQEIGSETGIWVCSIDGVTAQRRISGEVDAACLAADLMVENKIAAETPTTPLPPEP